MESRPSAAGPVSNRVSIQRGDLCVNRRNNREADVAGLLAAGTPLKGQ
jgi:hypothetical protein